MPCSCAKQTWAFLVEALGEDISKVSSMAVQMNALTMIVLEIRNSWCGMLGFVYLTSMLIALL